MSFMRGLDVELKSDFLKCVNQILYAEIDNQILYSEDYQILYQEEIL